MTNFQKLGNQDISLILQMMQDFYAIDDYAIDMDTSKHNFELLLANPSYGQAFLIQEDGLTLGYLILAYVFSFEFQGRVAILDELYLSAAARGKGLGKAAVLYAQDYALEEGCKRMFLEVESHNERAQKLYEQLGFDFHPRKIMGHLLQKRN